MQPYTWGTQQELDALGVADDPRVMPHRNEFLGQDESGYPYAVIEAISEGVVFTSLEHSVGEADAGPLCCVPDSPTANAGKQLPGPSLTAGNPMTSSSISFPTIVLVCSELVYRAYDGMLTLPLTQIMGRQTLPVNTFVEVYAGSLERSNSAFKLLIFLDMDERARKAFTSSEVGFIGTLKRSRFTFWQSP